MLAMPYPLPSGCTVLVYTTGAAIAQVEHTPTVSDTKATNMLLVLISSPPVAALVKRADYIGM
jgi:hypothetical protein